MGKWVLAVIFLCVVAVAQVKFEKGTITSDSPITMTRISPTTIQIMSPENAQAIIVVTCDPVMVDGKWTPHVKNCKISDGYNLDDVLNAMMDLMAIERTQYAEEVERTRKLGQKGIDQAMKSAALYKSAFEKCSSGVNKLQVVVPEIKK